KATWSDLHAAFVWLLLQAFRDHDLAQAAGLIGEAAGIQRRAAFRQISPMAGNHPSRAQPPHCFYGALDAHRLAAAHWQNRNVGADHRHFGYQVGVARIIDVVVIHRDHIAQPFKFLRVVAVIGGHSLDAYSAYVDGLPGTEHGSALNERSPHTVSYND